MSTTTVIRRVTPEDCPKIPYFVATCDVPGGDCAYTRFPIQVSSEQAATVIAERHVRETGHTVRIERVVP